VRQPLAPDSGGDTHAIREHARPVGDANPAANRPPKEVNVKRFFKAVLISLGVSASLVVGLFVAAVVYA